MYGIKIVEDRSPAGRRVLFYAGAKSQFRAVVEEFGFAPLDLGPLQMGRHCVCTTSIPDRRVQQSGRRSSTYAPP
jgi:predicted dinucleotide-binding enzyme